MLLPGPAQLLKPFLREETTIARAARELGVPLGALHYRVTQWCRAGLLEVVRVEPRRGRPVRVYRAVSRSFVIPAALLGTADLARLTAGHSWEEEVRAAAARHDPLPDLDAVRVYLTARGNLEWAFDLAPRRNPARELLIRLRDASLFLDPADAEAFAGELLALHDRYRLKRGARRYGLLLDLVPLDRPVDPPGEVPGEAPGAAP